MGAAKRLAELYLPSFAAEHGASMRLSAVRFGNVLGSQGSVAPRFAAQIAHGGPLTLTHPDMERYFLTMTEAVDFIARVISLKDETKRICTYVMDMGKPVSILDMAHEMIARAGREIEVKIIGSRPGEKLSEQLFDAFERVDPSVLEGVFAITPAAGCEVTSSDIDTLEAVAMLQDHAAVRAQVFARLEASLGRLNAASMANEAVAPRQYVM
jgi:O-antigen biosynthesis protein WbqV